MNDDSNGQLGLGAAGVYALVWRFVHMAVHRYGSAPTGQTLVVLTHLLLDEVGYCPTVSELADIVGLPKSSVSRYVSAEMSAGYLEEFIDPADRRRRRLRPTARALQERRWHMEQMEELSRLVTEHTAGQALEGRSAEQLIKSLKAQSGRYPKAQ